MTLPPRVLMLVLNPMVADSRVEKEATSLGLAGFDVTVLAVQEQKLAEREDRGGYRVIRRPYRRAIKEGLRDRQRRQLRRGRAQFQALSAVLEHPPQTLRRATVALTYVHLARVALRLVVESLRYAAGGIALKTVRSRVLPIDYWRGVVASVPDLVERCDVIHAHDLGTLAAAVRLAYRWERPELHQPRPRVVYDSHELYVEQNTSWTFIERFLWRRHERRWIGHADVVLTVSDSIATTLQCRYRLAQKPTVLFNAPSEHDRPGSSDVRSDASVGVSTGLAVYVGGIKPGRGVDRLVTALPLLPNMHLALLGAGHTSDPHLQSLLAQADELGVGTRVHLLPPVPAAALASYLSTADVGVHPLEPTCLNHAFALPNKLFDYVFAGLPVVVSDLPEMRRFVLQHRIGETFHPREPDSIAAALDRVTQRRAEYVPSPSALAELRHRYGWQTQERKLVTEYRRLVPITDEVAA